MCECQGNPLASTRVTLPACKQGLTGTVFRLLLLAESTQPPHETEISFFFRALEYGIFIIIKK